MGRRETARTMVANAWALIGAGLRLHGARRGLLNVNALRDRYWYPTLTTAARSRRTMYQTWHTCYARYIPNRTRRDGSAPLSRMIERTDAETAAPAPTAVLPKYSR